MVMAENMKLVNFYCLSLENKDCCRTDLSHLNKTFMDFTNSYHHHYSLGIIRMTI